MKSGSLHLRVVQAHRQRGEEREHVEVVAIAARVVELATLAALEIEDDVVAVDQEMLGERFVDPIGSDARTGFRRHGVSPSDPVGTTCSSFSVESTMTVRV